MKKTYILALLLLVLLMAMTGCGKKQAEEVSSEIDTIEAENVSEEERASDIVKADDTEKYEAFMSGMEPVYVDFYLEHHTDYSSVRENFDEGRAYPLHSFLNTVVDSLYLKECSKYNMDDIQYAYIDCGMDGIPELAIQCNDILTNDSEYTFQAIIKELEGKLQLVYFFEFGYRTDSNINTNGGYWFGGSQGAGAVYSEYGYIDADGIDHAVYSDENFYTLFNLYLPDEPDFMEKLEESGLSDYMQVRALNFEPRGHEQDEYSSIVRSKKYAYFVTDENYNVIEDASVYEEDSEYYKLMKETGLSLYMPEELDKLLENWKKESGFLPEHEEEANPKWKSFYHMGLAGEAKEEEVPYFTVVNPSWEYYSTVEYNPENLPVNLVKISEEPNDIIDDNELQS